jgi:hypothetical protein
MAYSNKLRPRKHLKGTILTGIVGKFDFSEGICWDDMTAEMLVEYATKMKPEHVKRDLIGEIPKPKVAKVSEAPKTAK